MNQATEELAPLGGISEPSRKISLVPISDLAQSDALIEEWVKWMVHSRGLLPATVSLYRRSVENACADLGDLAALGGADLERWVLGKGGSPSSHSNRIASLGSFYRFLVKFGHRADNPTSGMSSPKQRRGVPKPVEDLEGVLGLMDSLDKRCGRRDQETRSMALFLSETGLRIHEAAGLNVRVPCPDQIVVMGKGHKEALVLLTDEARRALDSLGGKWPIGIRATQRRFQLVGTHPHAFRHYLGCSLAASGADLGEIQELLRHSSPATSKIYSAYSTERLRKAQERRRGVTL